MILATIRLLSMRKIPTLSFLPALFLIPFLSGCAAIGLTLLGVGAGVTTGTAVGYTLNGIAYRTFTAPLPEVRAATLTALDRMGIEVDAKEKTDQGELIKANAADRQIEVQLESVSSKTTRMRTVAKQGMFFKDRATAIEIIIQVENVLNGPKNNQSPNLEQRSSAKRVEQKAASSSEGKGGQQLAQIQQAQERLKARGFDPGPIDGILGPQTRSALNEYQAAQRLPTTGVLDEKTRNSLGVR